MLFEFNRATFETPEQRKSFAKTLSNIITFDPVDFEPYCPNQHNDYFWTLDSGNDWKVMFYRENPNRFSVTYRYQRGNHEAEESLGEWLKYRLGCKAIE